LLVYDGERRYVSLPEGVEVYARLNPDRPSIGFNGTHWAVPATSGGEPALVLVAEDGSSRVAPLPAEELELEDAVDLPTSTAWCGSWTLATGRGLYSWDGERLERIVRLCEMRVCPFRDIMFLEGDGACLYAMEETGYGHILFLVEGGEAEPLSPPEQVGWRGRSSWADAPLWPRIRSGAWNGTHWLVSTSEYEGTMGSRPEDLSVVVIGPPRERPLDLTLVVAGAAAAAAAALGVKKARGRRKPS
ncbi:MAG: hypothetical protein DRO06_04185, partial [Thermoproteota archaeon]